MEQILNQIISDPEFPEGDCWSTIHLQSNEQVIREGEYGRKLYLVRSGNLRISARVRLDGDRKFQPGLSDLKAGDLFGELSLITPQPRSASVITLSPCTLVEIDCRLLRDFLDQHPEIGYQFLRELFQSVVERFNVANHRIEQLLAWGLKVHKIDQELSDS